ncbi:protein RhsA [Salmonella enterica subsp. salamae]|nr:protein RhsA [Salmonella enterica subsp. salamae]
MRISGPQQTREYRYSEAGRLTGVHTTAANLDITLPYATDPAGNRLPDREFYPESSSTVWPDNRITEDMQYRYRYDRYGRLTEKTDRIPEGGIRMYDERTHRYRYDNQHRLVRYVRTQYGETQAEGRYIYDPTGRRVGKRVWKREPVHWSETQTELSRRPYETWYGWEGDRLVTIRTQQRRVQTVYAPGSFTPLLRVETENTELAKTRHRSLAEKLEQEGSGDGEAVQFPAALRVMLDRLEDELRRDAVSEASRAWLTQCGLTAEQMKNQLEPRPEPERKLHLYHCDHRGLPLALISPDNTVAWRAEYDEWGNLLGEENPEHLEQLIWLPGQQYDDESGLYYNRHRYYNPGQGRYITQDPIGLEGGWNLYNYPLNPIVKIDPLGQNPNPIPGADSQSGKEIGGYVNSVSDGRMSYEDGMEGIRHVVGPDYGRPSGAVMIDGGLYLDYFGGGNLSIGAAIGTSGRDHPNEKEVCAYYSLCDHSGIGTSAGLLFTISASNADLSPGISESRGYSYGGALLAGMAYTDTRDKTDSSKYTRGVSMGPGFGDWAGELTCSQHSRCLSEIFDLMDKGYDWLSGKFK